MEDIKRGIVQTPLNPDVIFTDDPLRILRAIRFTMKYDWDLPMFMIKSIKRNVSQLKNISQERIRDEINKMLLTGSPDRAIKLMRITGVLDLVIPEFKAAYKMVQNKFHHKNVFSHTLDVLKNTQPTLIQRLSGLFHDIGKTVTRSVTPTGVHFYGHELAGEKIVKDVMTRLKYPTELIDAVAIGVRNHMRLKSGKDGAVVLSDKALRKFKVEIGSELENVLGLIHADNISHSDEHSMPNQVDNIKKRLDSFNIEKTVAGKPKLPISGTDLKEMGIKPGPIYGKIMNSITEKWYENPTLSREQAMHIVKSILGSEKQNYTK